MINHSELPVSPKEHFLSPTASGEPTYPVAGEQVGAPLGQRVSLERLLGLIGALLIISPKINLIPVEGQTAGIRVDDLLILLSWIPFTVYLLRPGTSRIRFFGYMQYIGFTVVSIAVAALSGWPPHPLFPLRLIEYSTFILFGRIYARHFDIRSFLNCVVCANAIVMVAQYFGVLGGFTINGYEEVGRVVGLTAGPWEIGYILDVVFALQVASGSGRSTVFSLRTAVLFGLLLLTGSRAATAVFLIVALVQMLRGGSFTRVIIQFSLGIVLLGVILVLAGDQLFSRSQNLFSSDNLEYVENYFDSASAHGSFDMDEFDDVEEVTSADQSWIIRSTHWVIALKEWSATPLAILGGVGLGTFGPALDGAWLRILVESGLIGVALYTLFLARIGKAMPGGGLIVFATAANMLFIDINLSYKSMALLLFVAGYYQVSSAKNAGI